MSPDESTDARSCRRSSPPPSRPGVSAATESEASTIAADAAKRAQTTNRAVRMLPSSGPMLPIGFRVFKKIGAAVCALSGSDAPPKVLGGAVHARAHGGARTRDAGPRPRLPRTPRPRGGGVPPDRSGLRLPRRPSPDVRAARAIPPEGGAGDRAGDVRLQGPGGARPRPPSGADRG